MLDRSARPRHGLDLALVDAGPRPLVAEVGAVDDRSSGLGEATEVVDRDFLALPNRIDSVGTTAIRASAMRAIVSSGIVSGLISMCASSSMPGIERLVEFFETEDVTGHFQPVACAASTIAASVSRSRVGPTGRVERDLDDRGTRIRHLRHHGARPHRASSPPGRFRPEPTRPSSDSRRRRSASDRQRGSSVRRSRQPWSSRPSGR